MATTKAAFNRDGNRVPITQNGLLVSKDITFTTDGKFVEWKPIFEKYIKYVGNIRINLDNHIFNDETNFANIM